MQYIPVLTCYTKNGVLKYIKYKMRQHIILRLNDYSVYLPSKLIVVGTVVFHVLRPKKSDKSASFRYWSAREDRRAWQRRASRGKRSWQIIAIGKPLK